MNKKWIKPVLALAIVGLTIVGLDAVIVFNDPLSPFRGPASAQVGDLITDSASELLQSAAEAFLFLNEVEIAEKNGLNVHAALQRVDMAAARVEQALRLFNDIIAVGNEAGYEENRIAKLREFAYENFARENGLSAETMSEVSSYLAKGNVLGFYRRHVRNLQGLLKALNAIKDKLLAGQLSSHEALWSLLQQYNHTLMFGNYASLVFYRI
jgi:hypothetical protein